MLFWHTFCKCLEEEQTPRRSLAKQYLPRVAYRCLQPKSLMSVTPSSPASGGEGLCSEPPFSHL